jgi:DNA-binding response OmpR family regulator
VKKILLVEDDIIIANLYKMKLELSGYSVDYAQNGLSGIRHAEQARPDLVMLDLRMPVMDGEEFLKKFRKQPQFYDVPVIVLTNISKDEAPKTLWHYGIEAYIVKAHATPSEILDKIRKIFTK